MISLKFRDIQAENLKKRKTVTYLYIVEISDTKKLITVAVMYAKLYLGKDIYIMKSNTFFRIFFKKKNKLIIKQSFLNKIF